jgi:Protein of unknown function (DUF1573)
MKSLFALFAAVVLMTACQNQAQEKKSPDAITAPAGSDATATSQQDLTTVQWIDSSRDMGQITEGQKLEVSFRFKNTGNHPLIIKSVQPSCGCTVPDVPKEPIAPGEEGVIKAVFNSEGKAGKNNKTLTVNANTEDNQPHTLAFSVDVQKKN